MTTTAALEIWNETELRRQLLRIAKNRKGNDRERFYSSAWALITRLRAGRSREFYLSRVVIELCPQKVSRPVVRTTLRPLPVPTLKAHPCHWRVADNCVGADCIQFKAEEKTCKKDDAMFEKMYGPGATGPRYE